MTSPASVALSNLLPTLKPLPPRLVSLADSLLALSRQRASRLKKEEEIARAHACADIACQQLREKLRLPPTKNGSAPIKPAAYKKLLSFLTGVVGQDMERLGQTQGKRKREQPEPSTPSKKAKSIAESKSSATRTPSSYVGKIKATTSKTEEDEQEAPPFVMPAVRKLCRVFGTPDMTPHVYTGTCIVLKLSNLWPRPGLDEATEEDLEITDEMFETDITALITALYLMVLTRMMQAKMTSKLFKSISSKAVEFLERLEDEKSIEVWVKTVNKEGYAKGQEWWNSVPERVFEFGVEQVEAATVGDEVEGILDDGEEGGDAEVAGKVRKEELNLEPDPEGILLPGLGTMMQDAVDWTSEERKNEFEEWKQEILVRLESLPNVNGAVEVH